LLKKYLVLIAGLQLAAGVLDIKVGVGRVLSSHGRSVFRAPIGGTLLGGVVVVLFGGLGWICPFAD